MTTPLQSARQHVADAIYQEYNFGAAVVDDGGWEWSLPGDSMTRKVYLEADDGKQDSEMVYFTVRFTDRQSADLSEAYAINHKGNIVGTLGERRPAPLAS